MLQLSKVFEALRAAGLVVNLAKCEFGKAKVCYLGHEVGLGQVAPKQANLEAIVHLKRPCNVREVRRVLGMTGYYRRFVRNFSDIAQPLTKLLEKGQKFVWSSQCSLVTCDSSVSCLDLRLEYVNKVLAGAPVTCDLSQSCLSLTRRNSQGIVAVAFVFNQLLWFWELASS
ncbi:uncharacterized protein LOC135215812 [Macrobrachium nipponense]|uniref:uncharacterized protein LOC135215812 n=1 Tax=Macrobrachium nipponense TaxID=159736 RepID=UPI0030C84DC2